MGIRDFFKTLFGTSEKEKELKRRVEEVMKEAKNGVISTTIARSKLEKAQEDFHIRTKEILEKARDNVRQEQTPQSEITSG